jgi:hypothetical protein
MKRQRDLNREKTMRGGRGWKQAGLRAPFVSSTAEERLEVERMLNEGCPNVQPRGLATLRNAQVAARSRRPQVLATDLRPRG